MMSFPLLALMSTGLFVLFKTAIWSFPPAAFIAMPVQVAQTQVGNRAPAGTVVGQNPRGSILPDQVVTLQVSNGTVPSPPTPPSGPPPLAGGTNTGATGGGG